MNKYPKARSEELVISEVGNELLIYDLKINKAFCLNETCALVWQLSDGENSISEIRQQMSRKLKTQVSDELVWLALDGLRKDDLLEKGEAIETEFNGLNRREVIKKIGLSSMIAFPLISSIVAPLAINAQSILPLPLLAVCSPPRDPFCPNQFPECVPPPLPCESGNCRSLSGSPDLCCVSSATAQFVYAPGDIARVSIGVDGPSVICCNNQECCSSVALTYCCSGTATFSASVPPCDEGICFCN